MLLKIPMIFPSRHPISIGATASVNAAGGVADVTITANAINIVTSGGGGLELGSGEFNLITANTVSLPLVRLEHKHKFWI